MGAKNSNCEEIPDYTFINMIEDAVPALSAELISRETQADPVLKQVFQYVLHGWPNVVDEKLRPYKQKYLEIGIEGNCLLWGHRVIVPKSLQKRLLAELHEVHMGIIRMKAIARSYIWWPGVDNEIAEVGKQCSLCLESAPNPPRAELHPWNWPDAPNERIHIDFLGPVDGKMYLAIIDAHSKWVDIKQMPNITADTTIAALREYFATWGIPTKIVSDNGPTFCSKTFQNFIMMNGIHHIRTPPYHPASNGAAENCVRTFKDKFKLLCQQFSPSEALTKYLFHYRSTPHCTTGVSPAELQLNRKFKTRWDLLRMRVGERVEMIIKRNISRGTETVISTRTMK